MAQPPKSAETAADPHTTQDSPNPPPSPATADPAEATPTAAVTADESPGAPSSAPAPLAPPGSQLADPELPEGSAPAADAKSADPVESDPLVPADPVLASSGAEERLAAEAESSAAASEHVEVGREPAIEPESAPDAALPGSPESAELLEDAASTERAGSLEASESTAAEPLEATESILLPPEDGEADDEPIPTTFAELGLTEGPLLAAVEAAGWTSPTPVQARTFGPISASRDVLVQSQTGTGKTGAFCLPWLASRFVAAPASQTGVQLLVLVPTRELAKQVCDQLVVLARDSQVVPLPLYGGTAIAPQLDALKAGVHAVVGTPGRILDHIRRRTLKLDHVGMVVLDEADEMLSMGFLEDIHSILDACPRQRQTCLFSATVPVDVERIARRYMRNPVPIRLSGDQVAAAQVTHAYYTVSGTLRSRDLLDMIALEEPSTALIFCNTREETNLVANVLRREGYSAEALSSDLSQSAREHVLGQMRSGRLRFLVATDVASRGIDISHISHVINYTFPENAESYIHRTGRTGRAGRAGQAISLIAPQELGNFYYLKLQYPSLSFGQRELPPPQELEARRVETKLDQISSRFPELVSPEWRLLARNLMADPRGEHVIAYLLSEAMSKAPTPRASEPVDATPADYPEVNERMAGRRGRFRREREHDRERPRDRDRARDRDRERPPLRREAAPEPTSELETSPALAEAPLQDAAATDEGERRRRRRRRRHGERGAEAFEHRESVDTEADAEATDDAAWAEPAPPAVPPLAAAEPPVAVDCGEPVEAEAAELVAAPEAPDLEGQPVDDGASLDEGRRRRRRRRRRKRRGDAQGTPLEAGETSQDDASEDEEDDDEGDDDVAASPADETSSEGAAEESEGRGRRRRRRGQRRRPRVEAAPAPQVSQDQIVIDIDETELEIVRDEFGEIDELDDLTLKGRRRGVIDALQEEVELEDLSETDDSGPAPALAASQPPAEAADAEVESEGDAEDDAGDGDESELSEDEAKRRKRRRRRRKKKKAEPITPELTAPPHKDFWEVWAARFTYQEFEDDRFRGGTAATADDEDDDETEEDTAPPAAPPQRPNRARTSTPHHGTAPTSASLPTAPEPDGDFIHCALNVGRIHGKKSAHIRELLASDFDLTGKSIRDLTVGDEMTSFRIGVASYERLSAGLLGYVFDDVELVLTRLDPPEARTEAAEASPPPPVASEGESASVP